MLRFHLACSLVLLAALSTGCLSKNPPLTVRYFEPPRPSIEANSAAGTDLVLVNVGSSKLAQESRMIWRLSPVELAFDDASRWVVQPKVFARRSLEAALLRSGTLDQDTTGPARLNVELTTFEGARSQAQAHVELTARLQPDGAPTLTQRFSASVPLAAVEADALAAGLGTALDDAASSVAAWVSSQLAPK